jgi:CheY-like chemotaxis protein
MPPLAFHAAQRREFWRGGNFLQFAVNCPKLAPMTQPLALLLCEKLLIGRQLATRLQDLDYRVQTVAEAGNLVDTAQREKPLLIIVYLESDRDQVCPVIATLRANPVTAHIPVIAFTAEGRDQLQASAREAGATLVVTGTAMATHLNQLLDQALALD